MTLKQCWIYSIIRQFLRFILVFIQYRELTGSKVVERGTGSVKGHKPRLELLFKEQQCMSNISFTHKATSSDEAAF